MAAEVLTLSDNAIVLPRGDFFVMSDFFVMDRKRLMKALLKTKLATIFE